MNYSPNASLLNLNAFSCADRVYAGTVRFLLLLTAILLITTPLTQSIWTWDHFLQGGQDFESGALASLATLLLVFLLAQHLKQSAGLLAAIYSLFFFPRSYRVSAGTARSAAFPVFCGERAFSLAPGSYRLPLQI